ncbi:hypothetical protein F8388_011743 [Cannabis sativa]|uniref:DUF4283 domain-containing protein n=1 Tax=Cannabis sativa TaxID=3483 RepID=A0A7J6FGQ1_CANSA|nr:hypothetical protein F8388_011743 [Cannabis sativa]
MADATLSALFEDSVQVSTKDLSYDLHPGEVDQNDEPSRILLGKIYCYSRLGPKAIHGSLRNAWNSLTGWSWKEREDGILQFTFQTRMDAENVLLRRPWLVCGHLLVLMPWPSWLSISEVVFDQTPIWVRLKSIPPFYWNKTNLKELAGKVSTSYELPRHIENNCEREKVSRTFGFNTNMRDYQNFVSNVEPYPMNKNIASKTPQLSEMKKALKDPTIRNQLAIKRSLNAAEASEWRELRRQFPGKRRQVEVTVEERPETDEIVLNCFSAVDLPRIGEVTPFDNTAEGVVEKVIPIRPLKLITTTLDASTDPGNNTETESTGGGTEACSQSDVVDKTNGGNENLPGNGKKGLNQSSDSDPHSSSGVVCKVAVSERENFTLYNNFQVGLSYNTLLGQQAQPLDWPSRECWANAFRPLTGSITVDKFQREPTILNPILSIDDFNCYDSGHGPRKRKAVDGFYMIPGVLPTQVPNAKGDDTQLSTTNIESQVETEEAIETTFSPGSNDDKPIKRKRGRPRKYEQISPNSALNATKRGRPSKTKEFTGVISQSLKKKGAKSSSRGKEKLYRNLWNAKCIDLAIDLDNHFVVIEKTMEDKPSCIIEELGDNVAQTSLTDGVLCKIVEADKNVLIGTIESDPSGIIWNFMGIYGPPTMTGRELFWNRIGDLLANGSALASTDWRIFFPNAIVELLTVGTSDHKPILLNIDGGVRCTKAQFKYELMWGRDPRCSGWFATLGEKVYTITQW